MINLTLDVQINVSHDNLHNLVRNALKKSARLLREAYGLEDVPAENITTKTHHQLSFSKFAELGLLKSEIQYTEEYVKTLFVASQTSQTLPQDLFEKIFPPVGQDCLVYKKTLAPKFRSGIGMWLVVQSRLFINPFYK